MATSVDYDRYAWNYENILLAVAFVIQAVEYDRSVFCTINNQRGDQIIARIWLRVWYSILSTCLVLVFARVM